MHAMLRDDITVSKIKDALLRTPEEKLPVVFGEQMTKADVEDADSLTVFATLIMVIVDQFRVTVEKIVFPIYEV